MHRVALRRGDEVVVVDEQEQPRAGPARHFAGRRVHLQSGQPGAQRGHGTADDIGGGDGVHHVADLVRRRDRTEQAAPIVQRDDLRLLRRPSRGDATGERPQQVRLARLDVADDEEVRFGVEIDEHRRQGVLVHPDRHRSPGRRDGRQFGVREFARQQPDVRRRRARPCVAHPRHHLGHPVDEVVDGLRTVDPGQRGQEVQLVRAQAAARTGLGYPGRHPPVDVGLRRIAETEFQPAADQVTQRRAQFHPALDGQHHVHAVAETAGGDLGDRRLHRLVVLRGPCPSRRRPGTRHRRRRAAQRRT